MTRNVDNCLLQIDSFEQGNALGQLPYHAIIYPSAWFLPQRWFRVLLSPLPMSDTCDRPYAYSCSQYGNLYQHYHLQPCREFLVRMCSVAMLTYSTLRCICTVSLEESGRFWCITSCKHLHLPTVSFTVLCRQWRAVYRLCMPRLWYSYYVSDE